MHEYGVRLLFFIEKNLTNENRTHDLTYFLCSRKILPEFNQVLEFRSGVLKEILLYMILHSQKCMH
jgi:hypothetical protein